MPDPDSRYEFQSQVSASRTVIPRLQNRLPAMLSFMHRSDRLGYQGLSAMPGDDCSFSFGHR